MSFWSRWRARTRTFVHRDALDHELDRELADWVDELTARYEAEGVPREEARRRALVETEGVEQVKDRVRDVRARWFFDRPLERLRFEISTAMRSLRATPVLAGAAIFTIAAAAGLNLAMFGLIDRALLSPPPGIDAPDRIFTVVFLSPGNGGGQRTTVPYPMFRSIREQLPALAAAAFQRMTLGAIIDGDQRQVNVLAVSSTYFQTLGARPALGAGPAQERDEAGPAAVVLSHAFWRAAFGGDPAVVGRRVSVGGLECVVAGVMPAGFSGHSPTTVDLFVPLSVAFHDSPGWDRNQYINLLAVVVRLAPGDTTTAVETQVQRSLGTRVALSPIAGAAVARTETQIAWWLTGVSVLIFVIGLANSGTLLVVRAAKRIQDVVIRTALGASRGRLIAQALLQAVIVAASATALSLAFAAWLDEPIRRILFPNIIERSDMARSTIAAAIAAGLVALVVAALANVWQVRAQVRAAGVAGAPRRSGRTKTMTALLLVQTTLSMVLLAGAAMFGQSLYKLAGQDFGMQMDGVAVVEFEQGPSPRNRGDVFRAALDQVRALPGVETVSVIDTVPFTGFNVPPISVPGLAEPPNVGRQLPFMIASTPELLKILDVKIVEGRGLTDADDRGALVVIVNQTMARLVWPGESAVGKCIRIGFDPDFDPEFSAGPPRPSAKVPCREVIGVARDTRQRSVVPTDNEAHLMQYFVPFSQEPMPPFLAASGTHVNGLMIRTATSVESLAQPIRRLIVGQQTDLPFVRVVPYAQMLDRQLRPWRLGTTLLALFSVLALGVAAVGLYASFAHAVAERRREMAIRLAIGARPSGLVGLVLRESLAVAGVGVAAGAVAAMIAGRWIQSLLFETTASDPLVLASAGALMLIVAAAATLLPARSASKADPNVLLRV
ncbi:MAG TPA: ABC transporter permease [Vicinamibacterales bacterium]|nr:ABC transporter permease [Vicinamibacterales bacterium]